MSLEQEVTELMDEATQIGSRGSLTPGDGEMATLTSSSTPDQLQTTVNTLIGAAAGRRVAIQKIAREIDQAREPS